MDIDSVIWYFTVASGVVALVGGYFINYLRRRQKLLDWAMIYSSVASSGITVLYMIRAYSAPDFVMHCILIVITVVVGFSEEFDVLAKKHFPRWSRRRQGAAEIRIMFLLGAVLITAAFYTRSSRVTDVQVGLLSLLAAIYSHAKEWAIKNKKVNRDQNFPQGQPSQMNPEYGSLKCRRSSQDNNTIEQLQTKHQKEIAKLNGQKNQIICGLVIMLCFLLIAVICFFVDSMEKTFSIPIAAVAVHPTQNDAIAIGFLDGLIRYCTFDVEKKKLQLVWSSRLKRAIRGLEFSEDGLFLDLNHVVFRQKLEIFSTNVEDY
ncbi:hypothetical protein Ddc_05881 [Ditylenchus destructor]|nr:hypothetical protein Ddc_05881 [Ditylenchus destructor]